MIDGTEEDDGKPRVDDQDDDLREFEREAAKHAVKATQSWMGALSAWQTFTNDFTEKRMKAFAETTRQIEAVRNNEEEDDISAGIARVYSAQVNSFFEDLTAAQIKASAVVSREMKDISREVARKAGVETPVRAQKAKVRRKPKD